MPTVTTTPENIQKLISHTQKNPKTEYTVDLENMTVSFDEESMATEMLEERRNSFLKGTWNVLAILRANLPKVREVAEKLPYTHEFQN